jgi:GT2 family glycosyltransferase
VALPDAVSVAYVHSNTVTYSWHFSLLQLFVADLGTHQRIRRGGIIAMRTNAGQLVNARNKAVGHLLESDVPWMLWLDTDMGFGPDILEQLLAAADPVERPIVGALCFAQRELEMDGMGGYHTIPTPTIFDWAPIGDLEGYEIRYDYPANALVRCSGTGSAAILVHRSVFERIFEKYGPEWYHRVPARNGSMGEDLSFCMRATALDIPVHVHTGVRTTHAKTVWLGEGDFLEQVMVPPATEEAAVLVPVMGRPEHAEPFMASLRASTGLATAYAVCDPEDTDAVDAWKAAGAELLVIPNLEHRSFAEKVNAGYRHSREPWMLLVGSDVRFHPGWLDQALAAAGDRYHVIGTNDLGNPRVMAGEHATHPLIRRSYVDEVGASWDGPGIVAHEGYRHWFVDDEIVTAAKQRGVWAPALASRVEHLHPLFGKGEQDETYRVGQLHIEADKALFEARVAEHGG